MVPVQRHGFKRLGNGFGVALPDSRLQRITQLDSLVSRQFNNKPAAAFQRDAHHDAAALLGHLERAIARPRLHRRHPASPSFTRTYQWSSPPWRPCGPSRTVRANRLARAVSGRPRQAGLTQQPCRSVALLSRVRTQNGNDRLRAPPRNPAQTALRHRPRARSRPPRRPRPLPVLPPGTPAPGEKIHRSCDDATRPYPPLWRHARVRACRLRNRPAVRGCADGPDRPVRRHDGQCSPLRVRSARFMSFLPWFCSACLALCACRTHIGRKRHLETRTKRA
jgi:hypothetical protein